MFLGLILKLKGLGQYLVQHPYHGQDEPIQAGKKIHIPGGTSRILYKITGTTTSWGISKTDSMADWIPSGHWKSQGKNRRICITISVHPLHRQDAGAQQIRMAEHHFQELQHRLVIGDQKHMAGRYMAFNIFTFGTAQNKYKCPIWRAQKTSLEKTPLSFRDETQR